MKEEQKSIKKGEKPKKKSGKTDEKKKDEEDDSDEDVNAFLKKDKEEVVDIDSMDEETRQAYFKK